MTKAKSELAEELTRVQQSFRLTAGVAALIVAVGAIFYHFVEKLSWLDSVYFCVVTLATIGYGDISPRTNTGKVFTIFYVLIGIGIIATFANLLLKRAALRRELKKASAKNTTE